MLNNDISQSEIPNGVDPSGNCDDGKQKTKQKPTLIPASQLDKMISDSMRDIDIDDDLPDDDPELLEELQAITGDDIKIDQSILAEEAPEQQLILPTTITDTISIIKTRIEMYELAENAAKTVGESAKTRRFDRGLKTLNDLLKQSQAGNKINVDDIPPEVSLKRAQSVEESLSDSAEN